MVGLGFEGPEVRDVVIVGISVNVVDQPIEGEAYYGFEDLTSDALSLSVLVVVRIFDPFEIAGRGAELVGCVSDLATVFQKRVTALGTSNETFSFSGVDAMTSEKLMDCLFRYFKVVGNHLAGHELFFEHFYGGGVVI